MNRNYHSLEDRVRKDEHLKKLQALRKMDTRYKPARSKTLSTFSFRYIFLFFVALYFLRLQLGSGKTYQATQLNDIAFTSSTCAKLQTLHYKPSLNLEGKFKTFGISGFIFTSAYRLNLKEFSILGLGALALHEDWGKRNEGCLWLSTTDLKPTQGNLVYIFPGEHHDLQYETVIIKCQLHSETASTGSGSLFINVHGEDIMVYKEKNKKVENPRDPFKYSLTYCSPPMYNRVKSNRVSEFLQYMYSMGTDHFVLYDAGAVDEDMQNAIEPFDKMELVQVVDIQGLYKFNTWHGVWAVNDCAYRHHYTSKWVISIDFDEYLTVSPPNTLLGILASYSEASWITFGSLVWSISLCKPETDEGNEWPIERMIYRWPHYYCIGDTNYPADTCLSWYGHRKYLVNPRKINALEIHRSVDPLSDGVDLNVTVMHNNHYKGLTQVNSLLCNEQVGSEKQVEWWLKDASVSDSLKNGKRSNLIKLP